MIPISSKIKKEYNLLINELKKYNIELLEKDIIVAITKCDLATKEEIKKVEVKLNHNIIFISSLTNFNLKELKEVIWNNLNN